MTGFTALDLSRLPAPSVIVPPNFEAVVVARKSDIVARVRAVDPALADEIAAILTLESEPAVKLQETGAYRELIHYQRVNDAVRAVLLAFASGADLDHKGADFETPRLAGESDERYRRRIQLAPEAFATTGARGAYIYHALTFDLSIVDAWAWRPNLNSNDGVVHVAIVGADGGAVSDATFARLVSHFEREDVRPLTDDVVLRRASVVGYNIELAARIPRGPDPNVVRAEIETRVRAYAASRYRIGAEVFRDGVIAAAMVPSVECIESAFGDLVAADHEIGHLTSLTVAVAYV